MNMNVPAWHIVTWPTVDLAVADWKKIKRFEVMGLSSRQDENGRLVGNILWAAEEPLGLLGLAWEWCELTANIFVMTDPMSVLSNVALVESEADSKSNEFERVLHLNNSIYQLPWQARLRKALGGRHATRLSSAVVN